MVNLNEEAIFRAVKSRRARLDPSARWESKAGVPRGLPVYEVAVESDFLHRSRKVVGWTPEQAQQRGSRLLEEWTDQEFRERVRSLHGTGKERGRRSAEAATALVRRRLADLRALLLRGIQETRPIAWERLWDRRVFPDFVDERPPPVAARVIRPLTPVPPKVPSAPWGATWMPWRRARWRQECEAIKQSYREQIHAHEQRWRQTQLDAQIAYDRTCAQWQREHERAQALHQRERYRFEREQRETNQRIALFRERVDSGDPSTLLQVLEIAFECADYPDCISLRQDFELQGSTLVVDLRVPARRSVSRVIEVRHDSKIDKLRSVEMSEGEHQQLYDEVVRQLIVRCMLESFALLPAQYVRRIVVNAWADNHEKLLCLYSAGIGRASFEALDLQLCDSKRILAQAELAVATGPVGQGGVRPLAIRQSPEEGPPKQYSSSTSD